MINFSGAGSPLTQDGLASVLEEVQVGLAEM